MSQGKRGGRPAGARNIRPGKAAIASYYQLLQQAAERGDVNAAGWLVFISEQTPQPHRPGGQPA